MALSSDKLCILNRNTCALRIQGKQNPMIAPKENNKLELRSLGALVSRTSKCTGEHRTQFSSPGLRLWFVVPAIRRCSGRQGTCGNSRSCSHMHM